MQHNKSKTPDNENGKHALYKTQLQLANQVLLLSRDIRTSTTLESLFLITIHYIKKNAH